MGAKPAVVSGSEGPVGAKPLVGTGSEPPVGGGPARVAGKPSFAVGAAKTFGPMILDAVNRYFMAKEESARAMGIIETKVAGAAAQVDELVERNRLDIARDQARGKPTYVTVFLNAYFTNDVLDKMEVSLLRLANTDESSFMSSVMSHEPLFGTEGKVWYVRVAIPVPPIALSASEAIKVRLDVLNERASAAGGLTPEQVTERAQLQHDLPLAEKAEEQARKVEIARPAVLTNDKKRAAQQTDIRNRLAALGPSGNTAPTPPRPPAVTPPTSFVPPAPPPPPAFLPGAPGEGPIEQAARVVTGARNYTQQLEQRRAALEARLGGSDPPTASECAAFATDVARWRLAMKYMMNKFTEQCRSEAVNGLGEMLDRYGPKLDEMRSRVGSES